MTLTYHDLLRADLSSLTEASAKWKAMGDRFDTLRQNYIDHVKGMLGTGNWLGQGANAFQDTSNVTLQEFTGARNQARAIGKLLDDAHGVLTSWKRKVEGARDQAIGAKMKVDQDGRCTYDFSKCTDEETQALTRDPESQHKHERAWTQHIAAVVDKAAEADHEIKLALQSASNDPDVKGDLAGFNSGAVDSLKEYQQKAKEDAKKDKKNDGKVSTGLLKGLVAGVKGFTRSDSPSFLGKLAEGAIEGFAEAKGFNQTQGVCVDTSGGVVVGGGTEGCLVTTRTPDGGRQTAWTVTPFMQTEGWNAGASATLTTMKSNADDWSQLKGVSWDKSASAHRGLWGAELSHSNAIGTTNSKGDPVQNFSGGFGVGLGTEIGTGFSRTYGGQIR